MSARANGAGAPRDGGWSSRTRSAVRPAQAAPRQRMMARPAGESRPPHARDPRRRARAELAWLVVIATLALAMLGGWWALPAFSAPPPASPGSPALGGQLGSPASAAPTSRPAETPAPRQTAAADVGPPGGPTASAPPDPTPSLPSTASPSPTRHPNAAPANAAEFDVRRQVIEIGFPLKPFTRYEYRDNWGDLRTGSAEHYNHAHSRRDGQLRRAHDGIDLYAGRGEPVLAPFDGEVVEPARLWQPWHPERYGRSAVIVSSEPTSVGYVAVLSHLDRIWVEPGQLVHGGEVIGTLGSSGNAEGGPPHLHFELRAPFALVWQEVGRERPVDAFNPYPSLLAADPRRQD